LRGNGGRTATASTHVFSTQPDGGREPIGEHVGCGWNRDVLLVRTGWQSVVRLRSELRAEVRHGWQLHRHRDEWCSAEVVQREGQRAAVRREQSVANGSVGSVRQTGGQVFVEARWKARNIRGKKAAILWRNGGSTYIKDWANLDIACDAGYETGVIRWDSTNSGHLPSNGAKYWLVLWTNNDRNNPTTEGPEFSIPLQ